MEPTTGKPSLLRNIRACVLCFGVFIIIIRISYLVSITSASSNLGNYFSSLPRHLNVVTPVLKNDATLRSNPRHDIYITKEWTNVVHFYSSIFQELISEGYLSRHSKSLCVETPSAQEVLALKQIGVDDSIGIFKKPIKPFVIKGEGHRIPFDDNTFDFIFSCRGRLDISPRPSSFASEIARTLKPQGFAVFHVKANDTYSFKSFLNLFNSCKFIKYREVDGLASPMGYIREIVVKKDIEILDNPNGDSDNNCSVGGERRELVRKAEPLIEEEPLKPWITLKRNIKNVKYLPSMVDISFKNRYVYIDVGARSYGSSIGNWFMKQYPKQNKTFHVYAIEADKAFHKQYKAKKKMVTLLPYAAWIRNETLSFEINLDPGQTKVNEVKDKGRGMGRIQPSKPSRGELNGVVVDIQGFDFAEWLKKTFTKRDFVVMKMDIEGTEFNLIPRLIETGAICLIDEMFLECHYNRWQRCCPGERSRKYEHRYGQCLQLFTSLRESGVLVHQWW